MTAVVIEEVVHLDEDWAVPCERRKPWGCGGDNAAEWVAYLAHHCPGEPATVLYCTGCRDNVLSAAGTRCPSCEELFAPPSTAFRLIEPLNRRGT